MAFEDREEPFLRHLRRVAPGAGLALLVVVMTGGLLGWWEEPAPSETVALPTTVEVELASALATARAAAVEAAESDLVADLLAEATPQAAVELPVIAAEPEPREELTAHAEPSPEPVSEPVAILEPVDGSGAPPPAEPAADLAPPVAAAAPPGAVRPQPAAPRPPAPVQPRAGVVDYVVSAGETLYGIATRFGVGVETIRVANGLDQKGAIRAGQKLQVPTTDGSIHVVEPGETLYRIASSYQVEQKTVAAANGLGSNLQVRSGQRLVIPGEPRPPELASRQVTPRATPTPTPTPTKRATPTATPRRTR